MRSSLCFKNFTEQTDLGLNHIILSPYYLHITTVCNTIVSQISCYHVCSLHVLVCHTLNIVRLLFVRRYFVNFAMNSETFGNNHVGWGVVFGTLILCYLTECFQLYCMLVVVVVVVVVVVLEVGVRYLMWTKNEFFIFLLVVHVILLTCVAFL